MQVTEAGDVVGRFSLPRGLGPCGFAVLDPGDDGRLTFWWVQVGKMRPYPWGVRWAPRPPSSAGMPWAGRAAVDDAWYAACYWPWKREVAGRIMRGPVAARDAFRARYPRVELPSALLAELVRDVVGRPPTGRGKGGPVRWLAAAVLARSGRSVNAVAGVLGVAWDTARAWVSAGEALLTSDAATARAVVVEHLGDRLGDRGLVERVAGRFAAGDRATVDRVLALLELRGAW